MELAMLFNALLFLGIAGYVIFRIARRFYRWAMGRPVGRREDEWGLDGSDIEIDSEFITEMNEATDPSLRFLPGNIYHEDVFKN